MAVGRDFFFLTFNFDIIPNLQKNCKNNTKNSPISFIQIHHLLTFCPIYLFTVSPYIYRSWRHYAPLSLNTSGDIF